jgi:hypothetical protein
MPQRPPPGQNPGQGAPFDWGAYVAGLVEAHGSLAAAAERLATARGYRESAESVERGLRRLRARGGLPGGAWGRRALAVFGLPSGVEARVRWMGQYHTRFTDLPRSLCLELLRSWDRPPVSDSPARVWIQLGLTGVSLRVRAREQAADHLSQAILAAPRAPAAARAELALVRAYVDDRAAPEAAAGHLVEAAGLLEDPSLEPADRACLRARWVDQRAYRLNKPRRGEAADHEAALALYASLPARDAPPFALCRRENGMGWSQLMLGRREAAVAHARASIQHAGDGGSLRLRGMALNLLARALGGDEGEAARRRALAIAARLEDEELRLRITR